MARRRSRTWQTELALVAAATILFYSGLIVGRPLLSTMALRMPENYQYLAQYYTDKGDYERALQACDRELERATYNFHARRLKAEILRKAGRAREALELLWGFPALIQSIRGRTDVQSRGWDAARTHFLLAVTLWDLARYDEALDELAAALDWHDPDVDNQCRSFVEQLRKSSDPKQAPWAFAARAMLDLKVRLDRVPERELFADGKAPVGFYTRLARLAMSRVQRHIATQLSLKEMREHPDQLPSLVAYQHFVTQFPPPRTWTGPAVLPKLGNRIERSTVGRVLFRQHSDAFYRAKNFWANLYRNTFVEGSAQVWHKTRGICIVAKGTACNEIWPILVVRRNGRIVGRRYVRSPYYETYTLPLRLPPGRGTIEVGFENDDYNKITGQDRNLVIGEMRFY